MKVFVVVGSLFPFDRLIETIDNWALTKRNVFITGQIGKSNYMPKYMKYYESLSAKEFNTCFSESDLIVSHAGMGVILKALVENKPIIVLPRQLKLKEHTTDHQMSTAIALDKMNYVNVAMDTKELLDFLESPNNILSKHKIGDYASEVLINTLREFIESN